MTIKGGKGFNKNFKGFSGRPQGSPVSKSHQTQQTEKKEISGDDKSPSNLKLGFVDIREIPDSVLVGVTNFLDTWGIRKGDYSLIGILVSSLSPISFSPLIILNGRSEVVVIREVLLNDTIEISATIRAEKIVPYEIYKSNGPKAIIKRNFVSNTLGDVFRMSGGFSLERLVKLLYSTIDSLSILHKKGYAHGHLTEWNVSAGLENQGFLLDIGLSADNSSIESAMAEDQLALTRLINKAIYKVRVKKEELGDKKRLQSILAPLLQSLSEEDPSKRPSLDVAKGLFLDLVTLAVTDSVSTTVVAEPDPFENMNFITEETEIEEHLDIPEDQNLILDTNDKIVEEKEEPNKVLFFDESPQVIDGKAIEESQNKKLNIVKYCFYLILIFLICFLSFKVFEKLSNISIFGNNGSSFDEPLMGLEELQLSWNSGVPSKMRAVARQAIYDSSLRDLAEEVIISPILSDNNSAKLIDSSLIRVAFSKEWEPQLNSHDRRYVLALALRELLKDEFPSDLPALSELHPAILLSVLSSTGGKIPNILNSVPASLLEGLPEPFGVAYQILLGGKSDLKASAEEVVTLAHIGTRGVSNPVMLSNFLKLDFERRLTTLGVMFSVNNAESSKVLDIILNHPNLSLSNPSTLWAKKVNLTNWEGMEASDKLFLTAGIALTPDKVLDVGQIARLFLNPSPRVRAYGVGLSIHQIPFKHKGAIEVLSLVKDNPEIVNAEQLTLLAQILEDPDRTIGAHMKVVQSFIGSEPPIEIVKILLLANSGSTNQNILDASLSGYLNDRGWIPDSAELQILLTHHDKVARMFAYQLTYQQEDKVGAILVLKNAYKVENDLEFKNQIKMMVDQLESTQK